MSQDAAVPRSHHLDRYDAALRGRVEFSTAVVSLDQDGPVLRGVFDGGRGFVTHVPRGLDDVGPAEVTGFVERAVTHLAAQGASTVGWKTRAHDACMPVLDDALRAAGFEPEEAESVLIGAAQALVDSPVPHGVVLRRLDDEDGIRRMSETADVAFGESPSRRRADSLVRRWRSESGAPEAMQLWAAEVDGEFVCTGRLEPVPGTEFAGVWGGATLPAWRGRGVYRALTAARARAALDLGKTLIQSDSTEHSRPILERAGLIKVTETTPYQWNRP